MIQKYYLLYLLHLKNRYNIILNVYRIKKGELVGYDYRFVAKEDMLVATIPIGYADGYDMKYIGIDLYGLIDNTYHMFYYMIPLVTTLAVMDNALDKRIIKNDKSL